MSIDTLTPFEHDPGERDERGRFEPFYVPRGLMPQIDEADYPAMIEWLIEHGVAVDREIFHPDELRFHQRVDRSKVRVMPLAVARKPVLVSADLYLIDGNHREEWHLEKGVLIDAFVIRLPFTEAVELLCQFPGAYTFHPDTPERN